MKTMTIKQILSTSAIVLALAAPAFAQDPNPTPAERAAEQAERNAERAREQAERNADRAREQAERNAERAAERAAGRGQGVGIGNGRFNFQGIQPNIQIDIDAVYDAARQAIENSQFNVAIRDLDRVLGDTAKQRADAALYWKAYSQSKLDLDKEALNTIKELTKEFSKSSWVKDAKALEIQIQAANGQPISAELESALMACLEKSRARRPQTARDLVSLLSRSPADGAWTTDDADAWWGRHEHGEQLSHSSSSTENKTAAASAADTSGGNRPVPGAFVDKAKATAEQGLDRTMLFDATDSDAS